MAGLLDFLMNGQQPQAQAPQDMVQGILSSRFQQPENTLQPNLSDYSSAIAKSYNFQPTQGVDVAQNRAKEVMQTLATISAMQRTNLMMLGGQTGALINRFQEGNPNASIGDAISAVKAPVQNMAYNNGQVAPLPGAPQSAAQMSYGKQSGEQQAKVETAAPIAANTEIGKTSAENAQTALANTDIVNQYNQLISDSKNAPSGFLESNAARISNVAGMPTAGAVAQGTFDADLNNLYLATIRSLKGTGRVMEQELNRIAESAPKPTDSNEVKIAKANAHMTYYQNRMAMLGFDPATGQPANARAQLGTQGAGIPLGNNSNQSAPVNLTGTNGLPAGISDEDMAEYKKLRGIP